MSGGRCFFALCDVLDESKELSSLSFVQPLGQIAIFYVPSRKLGSIEYGREGKTPRKVIEEFFLEKFGGLTHEQSNIQGQWRAEDAHKTLVDQHDRYEVSFAGQRNTIEFLEFVSDLCALLEEESIYLTMGDRSWLVKPRGQNGQTLGRLETRPG